MWHKNEKEMMKTRTLKQSQAPKVIPPSRKKPNVMKESTKAIGKSAFGPMSKKRLSK